MPRNGSGSYSLPEAAFVPGTVILSSAVNNDFSDIATALTGSLARDGQGGMTDTLPLALTGFNYLADINTGMRRTAADTQAIECGGVDIAEFTTTGMSVAGDIDATEVKQNGVTLVPVGGIIPYAGSTEPSGWLFCAGQSLLRADYPSLFAAIGTTYGAADGTHFSLPDLKGRIPAGRDNMGGSAAGRLTSTTMSPDGNTLAASGGAQTQTISQGNLPSVNFTVTIPAGQGGHTHSFSDGGGNFVTTQGGGSNGLNSGSSILAPTGLSINPAALPALAGTAASGGSGTALNTVQPTLITNYIIFAGV